MDYDCPNCRSAHTQSVRMAILEGAFHGGSRGMFFGLGLPGALGFGWTSGEHEMRNGVARKYMLPPEPSARRTATVVGFLAIAIGLLLAIAPEQNGGKSLWMGLFFVLGVVLVATDFVHNRSLAERRAEWAERLEQLRRAWVCRRCGHEWHEA